MIRRKLPGFRKTSLMSEQSAELYRVITFDIFLSILRYLVEEQIEKTVLIQFSFNVHFHLLPFPTPFLHLTALQKS